MYLKSKSITGFDNLICGALSDINGQLVFKKGLSDKLVVYNRKKYFKKLGINLKDTVFQQQVHSANISLILKRDKGKGSYSVENAIKNSDAMIFQGKKVFLCSFTADCVPVSFFDPKTNAFGIAHAGWKGVLNFIAQKTAQKLNKIFKVKYSNLLCYLGPSIGSCCYEVSKAKDDRVIDFLNKFDAEVVIRKGDKIYLDLKQAISKQLLELGVLSRNIEKSDICTCCAREYNLPSYYREGKYLQRNILSVIGINKY